MIGPSHGGHALEIELPEAQIGTFPEFGRFVTLTFDRQLARDRKELFPLDFESSFFRKLVAVAKARQFDGLFAAAANHACPGWLGIYHLRWQDAAGNLLEDELVPVRCAPIGGSGKLERETLGKLLLGPLVGATPGQAEGATSEQLRAAAEREAGRAANRNRHPSSLFLLAAATRA